MKSFFKFLGSTILSGVIFFVAVSGAFILRDYWDRGSVRYPLAPPASVIYDSEKLGKLIIEKHSKVEIADKFTVRGVIRNNADLDLHHVQLEIGLFAGQALLTTCRRHDRIDQISPGETVAFQITCIETQGKGLPEYIRYEVYVESAAHYDA